MSKLEEQIKVVAETREVANRATVIKNLSYNEWVAANARLIEDVEEAKARVQEEENTLRELTLAEYKKTKDKSPAPGVGVREVSTLTYESERAYRWALEHSLALSLDKKAFENIAKTSDIDFVTITKEPQATIAADLCRQDIWRRMNND